MTSCCSLGDYNVTVSVATPAKHSLLYRLGETISSTTALMCFE